MDYHRVMAARLGAVFSTLTYTSHHPAMFRKLFASLLLCSLALPMLADAQSAAARKPQISPPQTEEDLLPRAVFEVLLGEVALDRGKPDVALAAYVDLARRSKDPRVLRRAFEIAHENRLYDLGLELARLWAQSEPQSFRAQQAVTASLVQLNRMDELAQHLPTMFERDKERLVDHLLYLNRMLAKQPDRAAVSKLVQQVASPYAGIAEAHYAIAVAAFSAGELALAKSEAGKAIDLRPDWELPVLVYARVLARSAPVEAIGYLRAYVDNYPKAADARLLLARLHLGEKQYEPARQHFNRILEDYPDSPEALFPAAVLAMQQDDRAAARMLLEKLLTTDFADKSTAHYYLAMLDEDDKRPESALAHYEQVMAGEYYLAARGRAAQIMAKQGRFDAALSMLRQTTAKTKEERLRLGLTEGGVLREAKRHQETFALLEKLLKDSPDDLELLYEAALAAERLGKFELFEKRLKRLLELKPDDAHALNALGFSLAERNIRLEESHALIKKASDLRPGDPFIMDSLGWVLFRQGKVEEGLKLLQAAYKIRMDPEIAAHIGEVLWTQGRREEALTVWREASQKFPQSEVLLKTIKKFQP